jgi:prephenate dehydrogenase
MLTNKIVTIVGLGLIGGSIAKAFKKYLNPLAIYAVTMEESDIYMAIKDGVINNGFTDINHNEIINSDLIILCTPVKIAIEYIGKLSSVIKKDCIITDVCSTKGDIIEYVNNLENPPIFIGGHPMAGNENSGYIASSSDLFHNATYILCRSKRNCEISFTTIFKIIEGIGCRCVELDAKEQDDATAIISHLPHVIAFSLVDLIAQQNNPHLKLLAAGGFKDITRIASSDADMWENIFSTNKNSINKILSEYINNLQSFKHMINNNNSKDLKNLMIRAKNYRNCIN